MNKFFKKYDKYLLLILSILVSIMILEVVSGVILDRSNSRFIYDSKTTLKLNPLHKYSQIFLDKINNVNKFDTENLIYSFGDSFSYVGKNNNFVMLLDNKSKSDIVNFGIPSIGPDEYLKLIIEKTKKNKPRYIFLNFFVGNDFFNDLSKIKYINNELVFVDSKLKEQLLDKSNTFRLTYGMFRKRIKHNNNNNQNISQTNQKLAYQKDKRGTFSSDEYFSILEKRMPIIKKEYSENTINSVNNSLQKLEEIYQYCNKSDITLILLILPAEFQVVKELRNIYYEEYNLTEDDFDIYKPSKILIDFSNKNNISYIDLLPYFEAQSAKNTTLYLTRDTHWNLEGNKLAADVIFEEIIMNLK